MVSVEQSEQIYSVPGWRNRVLDGQRCGADTVGVFEASRSGGILHVGATFPSSGRHTQRAFIAAELVEQYGIRPGDEVAGPAVRVRGRGGLPQLRSVTSINNLPPEQSGKRPEFRELIPVYPSEQLHLSVGADGGGSAMQDIDKNAPIGKGSRVLIVGPPRAGKTRLLARLARSIENNSPEIRLFVLVIGGWPEEMPDMQAALRNGEVIHSDGLEDARNHVRAAMAVVERAKRLVELNQDVAILIDGLTMLTDACDEVTAGRGFGLAPWINIKRLFGAARNVEKGGSLTIVATLSERLEDDTVGSMSAVSSAAIRLAPGRMDPDHLPVIDPDRSWSRAEWLLRRPEAGAYRDPEPLTAL